MVHHRKEAFDAREYGIGSLSNSRALGCDCPGETRCFAADLEDGRVGAFTIPNAACMRQEDCGIRWKPTDRRTGEVEARRSRRLEISSMATTGSCEYGSFSPSCQDGTIRLQVRLPGTFNSAGIATGGIPRYGTVVAPGLNAQSAATSSASAST